MNIDTKKLASDIKSIKVRSASIDKDVQDAALRAIQIADRKEGTGNLHFVNALYKALGKGARHVALTAWYQAFGGLKANTAASKDDTPFVHNNDKLMDLVGGQATPWYDMKPSQKPDEVFDFLALTLAVMKKKPKEGQESAHMALRDKLTGVVEEYRKTLEADEAAPADEPAKEAEKVE
jgi:hypothetical protein